jgi:hypothetical protein
MEGSNGNASRKFSFKVEAKELDRIIQARKNLDDVKDLAAYALRYRDLGWSPVALEMPHGADLGVDFQQPEAQILWALMDLALVETSVGLAIRLDPGSPLFVVRIKTELARNLDHLGNWRSACAARAGEAWEHHFLLLPAGMRLPPEQIVADKQAPLSVAGPGQLVVVPPGVDPASQETWQWVTPPWEQPPREPSPELLILLEDGEFIARVDPTSVEALPAWKEIYPLIRHSGALLEALLAPEESHQAYCHKILQVALDAGFQDLSLLLALLWHAPHSELRLDPEGRGELAQWARRLQEALAGDAPENLDREACEVSPDEIMSELHTLTAHTQRLERQLAELEARRSSGDDGNEDDPEMQAAMDELADLRQAVEDFLAGIKSLPNPK